MFLDNRLLGCPFRRPYGALSQQEAQLEERILFHSTLDHVTLLGHKLPFQESLAITSMERAGANLVSRKLVFSTLDQVAKGFPFFAFGLKQSLGVKLV